MGGIDFTFALAVGGFLLASWVDARIGDSRPEAPAKRIGLCLLSVLALQGSVGALYLVQAAGASQVGLLAAILGLFLPALIFALLTGLWLLRMLADIAGLARR
jgi:O-antigen ligase